MIFSQHEIDMMIRLSISALLGGLIGIERESHGKDAGFRTYAIVCIGSALTMIISTELFEMYHSRGATALDPSRVASMVISGIGFLGAGAIIRFPQGIKGLTTAAGIWAAAAIGLACGLGMFKIAAFTTVLVLIVLIFFSKIDQFLGGRDA